MLFTKTNRNILIILLLFAAVGVCYGATIHGEFVWDDEDLISKNALIRAPLWSFHIFKQDILNSNFVKTIYYRPLQILTYAVDYRLWGLNPLAFRLFSIFIHFFNSLLVFALTRRITQRRSISLITALLFAVHPVHSGTISYISNRSDILFFFFGFLFLLYHIRFREKENSIFLLASTIFLCLSLLSKEAAAVFPFLLLLVDITILRKKHKPKAAYHLPGFLIAMGYIASHYFIHGRTYSALFTREILLETFFRYFDMTREFLTLIFSPVGMHMRRDVFIASDGIVFPIIIAGGFVFFLLYMKKVRDILTCSLSFFLIALIPFALVVWHFSVFGEHWVYLASYGVFLFVSTMAVELYESRRWIGRFVIIVSFAACVTFCSYATAKQSAYWADNISLSNRILIYSSGDKSAVTLNATSLMRSGNPEKSFDVIETYIKRYPEDIEGWLVKGRLHLEVEEIDKAEYNFKKVLDVHPNHSFAYLGLALAASEREDNIREMEYLEKAIAVNPKHLEVLSFLGAAYSKAGNNKKAFEAAKKMKEADPYGYNSIINLGTAYTRQGYLAEGAKCYLEAIRLYPEKPLAFYNLGSVFYSGGEKQEARKWLKKAIMLDPGFKPALEMLREIKAGK